MEGAAGKQPSHEVGEGLAPSMIYTSGTTGHPKGAWRPTASTSQTCCK